MNFLLSFHVLTLFPDMLRAALGGLLCAAAHGDDLRLRDLRIHIEMLLRDHPGPEQSDADGIHK